VKNSRSLLQFALLFAILVVATRLVILLWNATKLPNEYVQALIAGVVNEFTLGLLVATGVFSKKQYLVRITCFIIIPLIIMVELACFHYESVFGRLPGADVLLYITQLSHISSSLNKNFPLFFVVSEFLLLTGILYVGIYKLKLNETSEPPIKIYQLTALLAIIISVVLQSFPTVVPSKYFWGSREALLWLVQSRFVKETYKLEELQLSREDFSNFMQFHGKSNTVPIINPDYPICHQKKENFKIDNKSKRNLIILILEGIGNAEMFGSYDGISLMPNLIKIAGENLYFNHIYAPGTKSNQALPAIFSGLPANPHKNYLWQKPFMNFDGFPNRLRDEGYRTAYFHGGDLTFEHQRNYLKQVGFSEIIEYDPSKSYEVYGWGYSDDVMFQELQTWIVNHKKIHKDKRYLASLFTLSTHHPYVLPPEWKPVFTKQKPILKDNLNWHHYKQKNDMQYPLAESLRFLDYYLGQFYEWYIANEKDSILIITGDHGFNFFIADEIHEERFDVPLIIAGLSEDERRQYDSYSDRIGSLSDLPATIIGVLNIPVTQQCDLSVDLLSPDHIWDDQRYVYAMGGDALERMRIWNKGNEIFYDRMRNSIQYRPEKTKVVFREIESNREYNKVTAFINNILPIHYYLLNKDAYFPKQNSGFEQAPLPNVEKPIYISHRGNINGEAGPLVEYSREALDAVVQSGGFEWVEIEGMSSTLFVDLANRVSHHKKPG